MIKLGIHERVTPNDIMSEQDSGFFLPLLFPLVLDETDS